MRVSIASVAFALLCIGMVLQIVPLPTKLVSEVAPNSHEWRQDLLTEVDSETIGRRIVEHDLEVSLNGRSHSITVDVEPNSDAEEDYAPSTISITPDASISATWRFIGWLAVALVSFALFRQKFGLWVISGLFVWGLFEATYGLAHIGGGSSFGLQSKVHFLGAATGTFVSKNHFAAMIYMSLGAGLSLLLTGRRRRLVMAGSVVLVAALLLSMSRGGILATAVAAVLFWPNICRGRSLAPSAMRAGAVLLVSAVFATGLVARFSKLFEGDTSLVGRINIWGDAVELWHQSPVFGSGLGSFDDGAATVGDIPMVFRFAHAHSEPLQLLAEGGLILFVTASILVVSFIRVIMNRRQTDDSPVFVGLAFSIVCLLLQATVDFPFRNDVVSILSAVIVGGLLSQCEVGITLRSRVLAVASYIFLILSTTFASAISTQGDEVSKDISLYSERLTDIEHSSISSSELIEDLDLLILELREVLPRNPIAPELHSHMAHAYALLSRLARTASAPQTQRSAEWYEANAEFHVGKMVQLQGQNPRIYLRAAHIQKILETGNPLWRGHRDHRLSSMERAIDLDPWVASFAFAAAPDLDIQGIEQMLITAPRGDYERGRALLRLGATDVAYEAFTRAVVGLESWAPAWFMLGEACRNRGDSDRAIEAYENSLRLDQANEVMRGWAQYWTGSEVDAIDTFSRFLDSNPGHQWAEQGLNLARLAKRSNRH